MEVFSYLEGFYNTRRRHSRLANLGPTDYETVHATQNEVSAWRASLQTGFRRCGRTVTPT
jgi:hypothetical protein